MEACNYLLNKTALHLRIICGSFHLQGRLSSFDGNHLTSESSYIYHLDLSEEVCQPLN